MNKVPPPIFMLLGIGLEWLMNRLAPLVIFRSNIALLFGYVFIAMGILLAIPSLMMFARKRTTLNPNAQPKALVISGAYKITRNPMYLGLTCVLTGAACMFGSVGAFIAVPLFVLLINGVFIPREESNLRQQFADDYDAYCAKVRRWI